MTLSTPLPASCRATEPSRILKLNVKVFYTLAGMAPQVSATVGAAALKRIGGAQGDRGTTACARDASSSDRAWTRGSTPSRASCTATRSCSTA